MSSDAADAAHYHRQACTECQRRKQKCSREWPCNHCLKRKVPDQCSFSTFGGSTESESPTATEGLPRRVDPTPRLSPRNDDTDHTDIGPLGYITNELLNNLGLDSRTGSDEYLADADDCPQLNDAFNIFPVRQQLDALVDKFFTTVNLHYFIINEPIFRKDYREWWLARPQRKNIRLQWTCLLLMVCACTIQQVEEGERLRIEESLGDTSDKLADRFHNAARELGGVIPVGKYHLHNVLWRLHSSYWFKAEAKFLEAWHVLGEAIREGQELGLHQESSLAGLTSIEQEIRRRVWCVLDTWDWQMSSGLGRPSLIDRTEVNVALPNLAHEEQPSPLLHMKLQSKLIREIARRFGVPKNVTDPEDVIEYRQMIEAWMKDFPDYFQLNPTGKGWGKTPEWLVYHRYYLWTMAYLMILNPMRPYMAKPYSKTDPAAELEIFAAGIRYARELTMALDGWVNITLHRDGWFHFQIFSVFDVASMLCAAIKVDENDMIPDRAYVFDAIDSNIQMLRRLNDVSHTAGVWRDLLMRQAKQLPRPVETLDSAQRKRTRIADSSGGLDRYGSVDQVKVEQSVQTPTPFGQHRELEHSPPEHELPGLDNHTSASISPSSDNVAEVQPQSEAIVAELQSQVDSFSQALDWTFFQDLPNDTELDWRNFELDGYFVPGGLPRENLPYES
ncbi:fungal specific transcription factor domain-containing protein [Sarocladium implicatum]|nr:fungal specific transcription factor domain-containing protein [Sarocladium implicatum]